MTIPEAVRTLRKLHGESQPEFASRVGVSKSCLVKLEAGVAPAPLDVLGNLAWCCLKGGYHELQEVFLAQMREVLRSITPGSTRPKEHPI